MEPVKLGSIITTDGQRDAVHVAIAPVIAGNNLKPGAWVLLSSGTQYVVECDPQNAVGIVDPFLKRPIKKDERFYMLLIPGTVTSLRHEWTHPAFADDKRVAEEWLRIFASTWSFDFEDMIKEACAGEDVCASEELYDMTQDQKDEFWRHLESLTGRTFSEDHRGLVGWRCGC